MTFWGVQGGDVHTGIHSLVEWQLGVSVSTCMCCARCPESEHRGGAE